jgi:hypothetical protein
MVTKYVMYAECCCDLKTRNIPSRYTASFGTLEFCCIYQQTYKATECFKIVYFFFERCHPRCVYKTNRYEILQSITQPNMSTR